MKSGVEKLKNTRCVFWATPKNILLTSKFNSRQTLAVSQFRVCILRMIWLLWSLEHFLAVSQDVLPLRHDFFRPGSWKWRSTPRDVVSPVSLFLSSFSGAQRIFGYVRPRRIVVVRPPKRGKRRSICGTAFRLLCYVICLQMLLRRMQTLNWDTATVRDNPESWGKPVGASIKVDN